MPGWKERPKDEFRAIVVELLAQAENGWVVDGYYTSALGDMIDTSATDIVCKSELV